MGLCESRVSVDQQKIHKNIENDLAKDKVESQGHVKLLLLGAAECGKSTVLKQMKILHSEGFSDLERQTCKLTIYENMIIDMIVLMEATDKLRVPMSEKDTEALNTHGKLIRKYGQGSPGNTLDAECNEAFRVLWKCSSIQCCYTRRNEFQLNDSCKYFFDNLERVGNPSYNPTTQDILNMRLPTLGIHETKFEREGTLYRVFDVGGQRSERRKWIHCFDDVHGIIFIIAVSEFDQMLREDGQTNRLLEAVLLYTSILTTPWFRKTSIILFLNKCDLFRSKIDDGRSISSAYPEYKGASTHEAQIEYLTDKFVALGNQDDVKTQRGMYSHQTCATDTDQVSKVLIDVIDVVSTQLMRDTGFGGDLMTAFYRMKCMISNPGMCTSMRSFCEQKPHPDKIRDCTFR